MEIRPIVATLRKHWIPANLIVLEIALACAVFCNAVFMIGHRVAELHMPNAIDQQGLVDISVTGTNPNMVDADVPRNLDLLRRIPATTAVAAISAVPFGEGQGTDSVCAGANGESCTGASRYMFSRGGPQTLGLQLLKGRLFTDNEYASSQMRGGIFMPSGHVVVITHRLARRLWPQQSPLGKQLWMGDGKQHYTVIGVVANVARPGAYSIGKSYAYYATFFPLSPSPALTHYVIRSTPSMRASVLRTATTKLEKLLPDAVIKGQTFTRIRDKALSNTRSMVEILVLVCVVMLAVTAFAVMGLSSFWVAQRRRQIGIRRAIGATRANILHYFQTENFLLSTAGIVVGMVLAFGANLYLMHYYQLGRMPWYYLPIGAVALWLLGQIAVLAPALRASNVPPVVAMRSA